MESNETIQTIQKVITLLKSSSKHTLRCETNDIYSLFSCCYEYRQGLSGSIYVLEIYISCKSLWQEYQKLQDNKFNFNFTEDKDNMIGFVKTAHLQIINHLKIFNEREDNYEEIAKLVDKYSGGIVAEKFGI
jgi:hypothetical protein